MKTSAESMSWYKKVDETWESVGVDPDVWKSTPADYKIVCKTIKALWKKEMGTKFPYTFKQVSGNRSTWCRDRKTFNVNPEKGWAEIIHSLGHYMGLRKNLKRPHCAEHAAMEYRLAKYVAQNNLVELSNQELAKPKVKVTVNKVAQRYANMLKRQEKWSKAFKQAQRNLAKVEREIKKYEKVHSEEKLTTKQYITFVEGKKSVKSYKQKCEELLTEHQWLRIQKHDNWEGEMRVDVWDQDYLELNEDYFDIGSSGEFCTWTWKQAYDQALVLIDRRS
tara:strand:+ start:1526 stop:2359 length:834 start_codon:yes stop_codon:yes gene_type:complete